MKEESHWIAVACDADRNVCQLSRYVVLVTVEGAVACYESLLDEDEES